MRAQEELGVVEVIEVVDRIRGAELDALDLLQVDVEDLLLLARDAAELHTAERILKRRAELPVEETGAGAVRDLVVPFLRGIVDDLAAVEQHHELVGIDVDDRTVRDDILGPLLIAETAVVLAYRHALRADGGVAHVVRLKHLKPLVGEVARYGVGDRFDKSHSSVSFLFGFYRPPKKNPRQVGCIMLHLSLYTIAREKSRYFHSHLRASSPRKKRRKTPPGEPGGGTKGIPSQLPKALLF